MSTETAQEIHLGILDVEIVEGGVLIKKINKFSSVGKAGIARGDVLVEIEGVAVKQMEDAVPILTKAGVGASVQVKVQRAGKLIELPMKLLVRRRLNLDLEEVDPALERKIAPW